MSKIERWGGGAKMEMNADHIQAFWYAVTTKSRQEKLVTSMLDYLEVPNFLPLISEERRWSDRKQMVVMPLFQGYVFVRITTSGELQLRVLKVPGVVDFVRAGGSPLPIPEREIEDVRAVLSQGVACSPYPFLKAGDQVRVVRGPLAGMEGTLIRSGSQSKLVISVEMIQRSVAVSVCESDVAPVSCVLTGRKPAPFAMWTTAHEEFTN
jgi:transcription termination/antitermination protein NusG